VRSSPWAPELLSFRSGVSRNHLRLCSLPRCSTEQRSAMAEQRERVRAMLYRFVALTVSRGGGAPAQTNRLR